jgi:predicted RNA binding protein YcfA (HicA-like mRNA interferase family)
LRLPRDISGDELARLLSKVGYEVLRQTGSHMRLVSSRGREHHVTIPRHSSLRVGTIASVLADAAAHFGLNKQELLDTLFGGQR